MAADRPAHEADDDEIEITPEMISAGVSALPLFELEVLGSLTEDRLVSRVYRAMEEARPRPPSRRAHIGTKSTRARRSL